MKSGYKILVIAAALASTGCAVNTGNLNVHLLCSKDIVRSGASIHDTVQHNKCNKDFPVAFTYSLGAF